MCLIAFRREDKETFKEEWFYPAADRNDDGIGIMYLDKGRVVTKKLGATATLENKRDMLKEFNEAPSPSFLHLRYGTAGNKEDETNAHPFKILSKDDGDLVDLYMMHNGILNTADFDSTKSDTWHFANCYIKPLVKKNPYLLCNAYVRAMISKFVNGSRICFLYSCGTSVVIEDSYCHSDEQYGGCWLSNRAMIGHKPHNPFLIDKETEKEIAEFYGNEGSFSHCNNNYGSTYNRNHEQQQTLNVLSMNQKKGNGYKESEALAEYNKRKADEALNISDKDSDNTPFFDATFELADTVDEQIMNLGDYDDDEISELVEFAPEAAAVLLCNLRDYFRIQSVDMESRTAM